MSDFSLPIGVPGGFAARQAFLLGVLACLCIPPTIASHAQPYDVDAKTEVRALRFEFVNTQTFDVEQLEEQIALKAPSNKLPFFPQIKEKRYPFSPIELQRDVARLRRFYKQNGFPKAWVEYTIQLDPLSNRIAITLNIDEGPPLIIQNLDFLGPNGQPLIDHLPDDLVEQWTAFRETLTVWIGNRLGEVELINLQNQLFTMVRDLGFAFSKVRTELRIDAEANRVDVRVHVDPGPRGWIDEIIVEGNESVHEDVVKRELPFREGDRYALRKLIEGQRQLFALPLFSRALVDLPEQPEDSTIRVRVRVREGSPRLVRGQAGYSSEGGLLAEATWIHRNFLGGARSFTAAGLGKTGLLATAPRPDRLYRASVSLLQPHVLYRKLNVSTSVFAEHRDDDRDRSRAFGGDVSLIYKLGKFRTASLVYGLSTRRTFDFRLDDYGASTLSLSDFLDDVAQAISAAKGEDIQRSTFTLTVMLGTLDNPVNPRRGVVARPYLEITAPSALSNIQYGRLGGTALGYYPLTENLDLVGRLTLGRLLPYSKSIPRPDVEGDTLAQFLRLRDVAFFGGGTNDVRGWSTGLLGPKVPDIEFKGPEGDSLVAEQYLPLGGLAQFSASVGLRFPLPFLQSSWKALVFLDAGQIWNPDERFLPDEQQSDLDRDAERLFFSTGAGVEIPTPLGPIQLSIGYKLNPSLFDLRDPQHVLDAALAGTPIQDVETNQVWRFSLHVTIGRLLL